jgi:hypothetical protein
VEAFKRVNIVEKEVVNRSIHEDIDNSNEERRKETEQKLV